MTPLKSGFLLAAALIGVSMMPAKATAQDETIHHVYMNRTNIRNSIHDIERESNSFRAIFERRYKTMFVANYRRTDESMHAIQDVDRALEVMQRRNMVGEKPRYLRNDVEKVLNRARVLNQLFRDPDDILATMRSDWRVFKADLNDLAEIYELPSVDA